MVRVSARDGTKPGGRDGRATGAVEVAFGQGLHWEELNAAISVPGLIFHLLDAPAWCPRWLESWERMQTARAQQEGTNVSRPRRTPAPLVDPKRGNPALA